MLGRIPGLRGDRHHIVRLLDFFLYRKYLCLVFEKLAVNLLELLRRNASGAVAQPGARGGVRGGEAACAIDMWGLGGVAAELLLGLTLFPGAPPRGGGGSKGGGAPARGGQR
ncbi:hypothetical protein V8C86DRAFT_3122139 [Haematococcus lacustris]